MPFKFVGIGFYAGDMFQAGSTLSIPATDGTITVTSVTPHAIYGTINVLSTSAVGWIPVTVTNPGGGSDTLAHGFLVDDAPYVNTVTPSAVLNGTSTTIKLVGDGFYPGDAASSLKLTSDTPGLVTFGTPVITEGSAACTDYCDTITVSVTPIGFTGAVPILDGVTITGPDGHGIGGRAQRDLGRPDASGDWLVLRADVHDEHGSHHHRLGLRGGDDGDEL